MLAKCQKIIDHGVNVFVNRQLIYNLSEQYFADHGVSVIEHADFDGVERLSRVTGAEIASTFENPELVKLGSCKLIEEIMIGEDKMIRFSGVPVGEACTIVLRGATSHMLDEAERSLHDALCVLSQVVNEKKTVYGGGCSEMIMAKAIDELATKTPGMQKTAISVGLCLPCLQAKRLWLWSPSARLYVKSPQLSQTMEVTTVQISFLS